MFHQPLIPRIDELEDDQRPPGMMAAVGAWIRGLVLAAVIVGVLVAAALALGMEWTGGEASHKDAIDCTPRNTFSC